jgi:hypothetical protein
VVPGWRIGTRTTSTAWHTPPPAGGAARWPCKWSTVWADRQRAARSGDNCLAVREWERRVPVTPRVAGCDAPLTGRTHAPSARTSDGWMAHWHAHHSPARRTPPPAGGAARWPCKWGVVWEVKSRAARSGDNCLAVREWERRVPVPPRVAGCAAPLTCDPPAPSGGAGGGWMVHWHAHQVPRPTHTTPGRWCGAMAMQVEHRLGGEIACGAQR